MESVAPGTGIYSVLLSSSLSAWEQLFSCGKHIEKAILESVMVFRGGYSVQCVLVCDRGPLTCPFVSKSLCLKWEDGTAHLTGLLQ